MKCNMVHGAGKDDKSSYTWQGWFGKEKWNGKKFETFHQDNQSKQV